MEKYVGIKKVLVALSHFFDVSTLLGNVRRGIGFILEIDYEKFRIRMGLIVLVDFISANVFSGGKLALRRYRL